MRFNSFVRPPNWAYIFPPRMRFIKVLKTSLELRPAHPDKLRRRHSQIYNRPLRYPYYNKQTLRSLGRLNTLGQLNVAKTDPHRNPDNPIRPMYCQADLVLQFIRPSLHLFVANAYRIYNLFLFWHVRRSRILHFRIASVIIIS